MNARTRLSSKGQIVIPKDIRDALQLKAGEALTVYREGRRVILEFEAAPRETISYDEFRRRVPSYAGPPVTIEDMTRDIGRLFHSDRDTQA